MKKNALMLAVALVAVMAGCLGAAVVLDDDFTGASMSPPDPTKWTTSPNPTGGGAFARVVQALNTELIVPAYTDKKTGWALIFQTFGPGSSLSIKTDGNAGTAALGVEMGFMSDTRANGGVFATPAICIATTTGGPATLMIFKPGSMTPIATINSGTYLGRNQEFVIDWIDTSTVRFAIDNGRDGTYDFDQTFTGGAGQIDGALPVQLWQMNSGVTNLTIDRVTVSTITIVATEPCTFDPNGGTFDNPVAVSIACATEGAEIHYTTDGTIPTQTSPLYSAPVTIDHTTTLQAKAWSASLPASPTTAAVFTFTLNRPFDIPYIDHIDVDGNLTKPAWADAVWAPLDTVLNGNPSVDFVEGYYTAKWGDNGTKVYLAMKVRDSAHFFTNSYAVWNGRDAAELYIHTTGTGPTNYFATQADAQEYTVGVMDSNRSQVWSVVGNNQPIPGNAGFLAAGKEEVDGEGVPTGWLIYEVAMTPFQTFSLDGSTMVVSPLHSGDVIGLDVDSVGNDSYGYTGMKGENGMTGKYGNYNQIGKHRLAGGPPVPGDVNGDRVVNGEDLAVVLAALDTTPPSDARADLDDDGEVTSTDVSLVLANIE